MCGDHTRQSRGGALAILSLPLRSTRFMPPVMAGQLTFHDCGKGSSVATHATFIPDESNSNSSFVDLDSCIVGIHETGDLTRSAIMSPFLYRFSMARAQPTSQSDQGRSVEVSLTHPMKIETLSQKE
ncbi:hypothetical protein Daesc_005752 [Daldinia eschscholtzii]|uniref:Uncharacterized protein n=1 Tax=Daldinia eschscholtzii TaxID=292717 RepID=A0AAX6MLC7_9PEZI